eukprot:NODE_116_length_18347_cov_2.280962.p4 type:complete len:455 gc:universal NODE_116_length_18347_cov_2.280962:8276-6912(-)
MSLANVSTISKTTSGKQANIYAVISESRGHVPQIGVAACDTSSCEIQLSEFSDAKTYELLLTRLMVIDPDVILFPNIHMSEHLMKTLNEYTSADLIPIDRKYFNDQHGKHMIENFALLSQKANIRSLTKDLFFSLSCVGALFKYLTGSTEMFALNSLNFKVCAVEDTMMIDHTTAKYLELVQNQAGMKNTGSLYNALNYCCTKMGSRKLRTNILQPSTSESLIESRQNCVQYLIDNQDIMKSIRDYLVSLGDIDKLILFLVKNQIALKNKYGQLNQNVSMCFDFKKICNSLISLMKMANSEKFLLSPLLDSISEELVDRIFLRLDAIISDEMVFENNKRGLLNQKVFAIKPEIDGMLDVARQMYKETVDDVYDLCASYSEETGIEYQIVFEGRKGYRFSAFKEREHELNEQFIERKKKGKKITFTTMDLMKLNERITENLCEVDIRSEMYLLLT